MGRRKKSSALQDMIEVVALLPWWVSVGLAIAAYAGFHMIATAPLPAATPGQVGDLAGQALWKGLATGLQYLVPFIFLVGAALSAITRRNRAGRSSELVSEAGAGAQEPNADKWSLELLRAIDWKRFEELCAEYFRVCGFHATTNSHGPDGGVDVLLYAPNDHSKIMHVVQCKQWKRIVGPKALRELLGVMTDKKVERGIFIASSTFNDEARRIAAENRVQLIDGLDFLQRIQDRSSEDQQRLLKVATKGDYLTPTCPSCGIKLLKRENKKNRTSFWGCANYPRCRYTLNTAN